MKGIPSFTKESTNLCLYHLDTDKVCLGGTELVSMDSALIERGSVVDMK